MIKILLLLFFAFVSGSAATVQSVSHQTKRELRAACSSKKPLICNLISTSGSSVSGKVLFTPVFRKGACRVRIIANVNGLTGRRHGFHIHTYGDTSDENGLSTGPHFSNPEGTPVEHGSPRDLVRHWGDFGNLVGSEGSAQYSRIDNVISLEGIVGRGITVHIGTDQGRGFQPTGDSGARVAVCVIGYANPASL